MPAPALDAVLMEQRGQGETEMFSTTPVAKRSTFRFPPELQNTRLERPGTPAEAAGEKVYTSSGVFELAFDRNGIPYMSRSMQAGRCSCLNLGSALRNRR